MSYLLVLYYSRNGKTAQMARFIARGAEQEGVEAKIRTVPSIQDNQYNDGAIPDSGDLFCSKDDLANCSSLALGSPTRFGNMAASLKHFIDSTSDIWLSGKLINKPAGVFTATASLHGGQESTLLSMMIPLLHHGMLITGLPYSEHNLSQTDAGGTPYGPTHWSGSQNERDISKIEQELCIALGKRLAQLSNQT